MLGNGDIWEADDALRMVRADRRATAWSSAGAAWAGRGCSPTWPRPSPGGQSGSLPSLGEVAAVMRRHAELLVEWLGAERDGCRGLPQARRLVSQGLPGRQRAAPGVGDGRAGCAELDELLGELDPASRSRCRRWASRGVGRTPRARCFLPEGWLESRDDESVPEGAELADSGG